MSDALQIATLLLQIVTLAAMAILARTLRRQAQIIMGYLADLIELVRRQNLTINEMLMERDYMKLPFSDGAGSSPLADILDFSDLPTSKRPDGK